MSENKKFWKNLFTLATAVALIAIMLLDFAFGVIVGFAWQVEAFAIGITVLVFVGEHLWKKYSGSKEA